MIDIQFCKSRDEFPEVIVFYNNKNIGTLESEFQFNLFRIKLIRERDEEISKYSIKIIGPDVDLNPTELYKKYKFNNYANLTEISPLLEEWNKKQHDDCVDLLTLQLHKRKERVKMNIGE